MLPKNLHFQEMLMGYSQETNEQERKKLEDSIWREYGRKDTVLALDMSGFSLLTRKYGIVHYLSMIRRMQLTVEPIVTSHGGSVIKFQADNCFATMPNPLGAVRAAISIQHALKASNLLTADELDIHVSIGIDYGNILFVDGVDIFGDAVNRACKMGEDIGNADEILISKEAMLLIPKEAEIQGKAIEVSVGGVTSPAFLILYRTNVDEEAQ
ncbi:MAG: adenylate/guanylate cyclase domain-containing protein [Anaerolineales bacterium]|nr:adenylate/guanylate cyclase domain-containing protein [Anaerolineales bacterium]